MVLLLSAGERIDVRTWLETLRYRELHSLVWGFGLSAGALVGFAIAPFVGTALVAVALSLLAWAFTKRWALVVDANALDDSDPWVERQGRDADATERRGSDRGDDGGAGDDTTSEPEAAAIWVVRTDGVRFSVAPDRLMFDQIDREPHYYIGGLTIGTLVGSLVYWLLTAGLG